MQRARLNIRKLANRAVKNFEIFQEELPSGRCALIVRNLFGVEIERIESATHEEAERHLRQEGYERIPTYVASELDREALCAGH